MLNEQDQSIHEENDIKQYVLSHFQLRWLANTMNEAIFLPHFDCSLSMQQNHCLTKPISDEEIFRAVHDINSDKALGPNGLSVIFFMKF